MCISLPAVATQSAVLPTWQHFDYQLVASRGVTSLVANETPSRARQLRTLPCCRGRRWVCASVCIHAAQGSVLPHKQFWEFCIEEAERYIPDIFIVVSKYSYSKMYCWAAFWPQLKRLRHSSHDYIHETKPLFGFMHYCFLSTIFVLCTQLANAGNRSKRQKKADRVKINILLSWRLYFMFVKIMEY